MNFKGVTLGLDGTLVNSFEGSVESLNYILRGSHFSTHSLSIYKIG